MNTLREASGSAERFEQNVKGLMDQLLRGAVESGASDLHIEPQQNSIRIRQRVNGRFVHVATLDTNLYSGLVSAIKVMNGADVAEFRVPQDGRMKFGVGDRSVDVRMSTLPTRFGESVVFRVLDRMRIGSSLDSLGIPGPELAGIRRALADPSGIILATGPTGSGKTTTLYCAIQEINHPGLKILTVEDPVEYALEGVVQVAVNPSIGLDFARVLRAFLRHDPDVMLIGEIRDEETASIGIHAAMTGHRVLSSLHTRDAASAVVRLIDMGAEPFMLAETLSGVIAQRLLKCVPDEARETYPASDDERILLGRYGDEQPLILSRTASNSGTIPDEMDGAVTPERIGIFEMLIPDADIRDSIIDKSSVQQIRAIALSHGMTPLREHAIRLVLRGQVEIKEMLMQTA